MSSKFKSAYYLNLSKEEPDEYPKIEHDRIDEIDEWDTRDWKKIKKQGDSECGRDMRVEKYIEYETLLGKRIFLKIQSSIVVDISKVGDEYYLYRAASSFEDARKDSVELNDVHDGDYLDNKIITDEIQ
jgi:hypothetical protein